MKAVFLTLVFLALPAVATNSVNLAYPGSDCPSMLVSLTETVREELRALAGVAEASRNGARYLTAEQAAGLAARFISNAALRQRFEETALPVLDRASLHWHRRGVNRAQSGWWRDTIHWRAEDIGHRGRDVLQQMFDAIRVVYELRTPTRATWLGVIPRNRAALNRELLDNAAQIVEFQYRVYLGFHSWLLERGYELPIVSPPVRSVHSGVRGLLRRVLWPSNSPRHLLQTVQLDGTLARYLRDREGRSEEEVRQSIREAVCTRYGLGPQGQRSLGIPGRLLRTALVATALAVGWHYAPENPFVTVPVEPPAIVVEDTPQALQRLRQAPPEQRENLRHELQRILEDRQNPPTDLERELIPGILNQLGAPPPEGPSTP